MEDNVLRIKITGKHNQPHNIPISELREFLENFEGLFFLVASKLYPDLKSKDFNLCLTGITAGSTNLAICSDRLKEAKVVANTTIQAIASKDLSVLPLKATNRIEYFREYAAKRNCLVEFYPMDPESKVIARIAPTDTYKVTKSTIMSETTLYGIVYRVGGKKPTVWIGLDDGSYLPIKVDIETAKKLATYLYQRIGFSGVAEYDSDDYSIFSFRNFKLTDYRESRLSDAFKAIADINGDAWKDVDVVSIISEWREEDFDDSLP